MASRLSLDEVRKIKEEFSAQYYSKEPYSKYVCGCGISYLGIKEKNCLSTERDDFCIYVMLRNQLPTDLHIPSEYEGVRVVTEITGDVVWL